VDAEVHAVIAVSAIISAVHLEVAVTPQAAVCSQVHLVVAVEPTSAFVRAKAGWLVVPELALHLQPRPPVSKDDKPAAGDAVKSTLA
tara:strand:+ start:558 stop:818 length:261 start_codon:yes stop_codon:yes gene_type:complete